MLAPGSALALSHITDENIDEEAARAGRAVYHWPEPGGAALHFYGGVAVKPAGLPGSREGSSR